MERTRRRDYNFCDLDEDPPASASASAAASSNTNATVHWGPQASPSEAPSSSTPALPPAAAVEKEHMFDKIVTPSDVGKLNRLVIPKQHAEKYFPLDTTTHEKGLLLNFEDRTGKPWRFRYSYWNSSQSYVMTKGWSRFVKEKRLDAGDTVSFGRGVEDKDRLFIDWKRRPEIHSHHQHRMPRIPMPIPQMNNYGYASYHQPHHSLPMVSFSRSVGPWAGRLLVPPTTETTVHQQHRQNYVYNNAGGVAGGPPAQYLVFRSAGIPPQAAAVQLGGGSHAQPMVLDSVPVVQSQAASKRFRLFGVNLDFPESSEGDAADNSSIPSQGSSPQSPSKGKEKEEPSLDLDM